MKCRHSEVEEHDYSPAVVGKGVRCVACHAVMMANAIGSRFIARQGRVPRVPIPLERKFWKEWIDRRPDPMSYEARMRGYDNIHMVR